MKKILILIFILLISFPFLSFGQGIKFSSLPITSPDSTSYIVGIKNVGGNFINYKFPFTDFGGVGSQGLNSVLNNNPNTNQNINIGLANTYSANPYSEATFGINNEDSSGEWQCWDSTMTYDMKLSLSPGGKPVLSWNSVTNSGTLGWGGLSLTSSYSGQKGLFISYAGNSVSESDTQININGGTIPLVLNGATIYCAQSNEAKDTIPLAINGQGTFCFTNQLADTSSVLRSLISGSGGSLQGVCNAGSTTTTNITVASTTNGVTVTDGSGDETVTGYNQYYIIGGTNSVQQTSISQIWSGYTSGSRSVTIKPEAVAGSGTLTYPGNVTGNVIAEAGYGRLTGQTAAIVAVSTYTVSVNDGSFEVSANVKVTSSGIYGFQVNCTYTDESGTSQNLIEEFNQSNTTTPIYLISNTTANSNSYNGVVNHIRAKSGTVITWTTNVLGTFTSVTYNIESSIIKIK